MMFRRFSDKKHIAAFNLGLVYIQMGEQAMAVKEFEFVLRHDPENKMVKMYLDQVRGRR